MKKHNVQLLSYTLLLLLAIALVKAQAFSNPFSFLVPHPSEGVTVTLDNQFTQGLYTACFDAKGEVFGIHCAKPGETVTKHYRWSPKSIKLQFRSGHLTNNPEKSFLSTGCGSYFPDVTYIDAWPKYSAQFKTNSSHVIIKVWPAPLSPRHYGSYLYTATIWDCSWSGIESSHH